MKTIAIIVSALSFGLAVGCSAAPEEEVASASGASTSEIVLNGVHMCRAMPRDQGPDLPLGPDGTADISFYAPDGPPVEALFVVAHGGRPKTRNPILSVTLMKDGVAISHRRLTPVAGSMVGNVLTVQIRKTSTLASDLFEERDLEPRQKYTLRVAAVEGYNGEHLFVSALCGRPTTPSCGDIAVELDRPMRCEWNGNGACAGREGRPSADCDVCCEDD